MSNVIESILAEYQRYKALAESAMAQLDEPQLSQPGPGDGNSVATLIWHVAGNLASRFTEFRTSDGEKPWRRRDEEFSPRTVTRAEIFEKWETGWRALFSALDGLTDADLGEAVTIRGQALRIDQALHRSLAHTAYHVGQIVYLAKAMAGPGWRSLSIPPGASQAYNESAPAERASDHVAALRNRTQGG